MTKREFLDIVFALAPNAANQIMDAFDEYVESAQLGTNLAEVGTDCISRQAAIDILCSQCTVDKPETCSTIQEGDRWCEEVYTLLNMPSAQPDIIRCRNCKFASGDSRICIRFGHGPIGELDFCAWAERRTDEA